MKHIIRGGVLALFLAISPVLQSMVVHAGDLYYQHGYLNCVASMDYSADSARTVTVWLRAPDGQLLSFHTSGAVTINARPVAYAQASPVGPGMYTCEAHFEQLGPGSLEEYDQQYYQLYVN
jgi:hypothetical protein